MRADTVFKIGYLIIAFAVLVVLVILINLAIANIRAEKDLLIFIGFLGISCWLLMPYAVMRSILKRHSGAMHKLIMDCITIFLVSIGGLYLIVEAIYISSDAQGGIAILIVPVLQLLLYGSLSITFNAIDWIFHVR